MSFIAQSLAQTLSFILACFCFKTKKSSLLHWPALTIVHKMKEYKKKIVCTSYKKSCGVECAQTRVADHLQPKMPTKLLQLCTEHTPVKLQLRGNLFLQTMRRYWRSKIFHTREYTLYRRVTVFYTLTPHNLLTRGLYFNSFQFYTQAPPILHIHDSARCVCMPVWFVCQNGQNDKILKIGKWAELVESLYASRKERFLVWVNVKGVLPKSSNRCKLVLVLCTLFDCKHLCGCMTVFCVAFKHISFWLFSVFVLSSDPAFLSPQFSISSSLSLFSPFSLILFSIFLEKFSLSENLGAITVKSLPEYI